jgi:hypothetical protein
MLLLGATAAQAAPGGGGGGLALGSAGLGLFAYRRYRKTAA